MPNLRINMLGGFAVWREDALIAPESWPTQKSQSFLKILLAERSSTGWVSADRLMEYLWPDLGLGSARNNLWVTASQARRVLEPGLPRGGESRFILSGPLGYRFNADNGAWVDVEAFLAQVQAARSAGAGPRRIEALEAARRLYTGPFLPENLYDDWAAGLREQLQAAFLELLDELAGEYIARKRFDSALALAGESLAHDPTREAAYRRRMVCFAALGEHAQALQAYRACRDMLQEELGVEPSPETEALYQQVLHRQGEGSAAPARWLPAEAAPPPPTGFVGRERELALLKGCVDQLITGQGQVVLIDGDPGIGKSRLVAETLRYAQQRRVQTLLACCYQIEQSTPFQPVIDLIARVLHTLPGRGFQSLPPSTLAEIAALVPEVGRINPQAAPQPGGLDETRLARLLIALTLFFQTLAKEDGLVLVIDDLHWSDLATIRALHHLARSIAGQPVLLLCTYRAEEVHTNPDLSSFAADMRREAHTQSIHLEPLTPPEITRLLEASGVPVELAGWFQSETEGNPFFLVTILQSVLEQGIPAIQERSGAPSGALSPNLALTLPEALRENVRSRLRRVPRRGREALETAAVLHRRFEFSTLQAVSGLPARDLLPILEDLLARHLLREVEDGLHYDFSHDKIREVVYHDLTHARRAFLHAEAARFFEDHDERFIDENAGTIAEHYEQAQNWPKAAHFLRRAGERSRRLFGLREAQRFYDRAIALLEAHPQAAVPEFLTGLYELRGETNLQLGDFEQASADLQLALDDAHKAGRLERERSLLIGLGMLHRRSDNYIQARVYLEQALAISRESGDQHAIAESLYHLGTVVWSQGDNNRATAYHLEAVEICRTLGLQDLVAAQAIHGLSEAAWFAAQYPLAVRYANESIDLATALGDKGLVDENLHNLGAMYTGMLGAEYGKAVEVLQEALEITREVRLSWHMMPSLFILSLAMAGRGDYEQAFAFSGEALKIAGESNSHRYLSVALDFHGMLLQDLNLFAQAEEVHARGLEVARSKVIGFWLPFLQANLAIDRLRQGRLDVGADLQEALAFSEENGLQLHALRCLQGLCEWALACDRPADALAFAARLEHIAAPAHLREALCQALRLKALALLALGRAEEAQAALQRALELAEVIGKPKVLWEVHASFGLLTETLGLPEVAAAHREAARRIIAALAANLSDPARRAGLRLD